MTSITQDMRFRQLLILYAKKHGVTEAAKKYRTNRQYIYRWLKRYEGTVIISLKFTLNKENMLKFIYK